MMIQIRLGMSLSLRVARRSCWRIRSRVETSRRGAVHASPVPASMRASHLRSAVRADAGESRKVGPSILLWIVAAAIDAMSNELRVGPALGGCDVPDRVVGALQSKRCLGS